MYTLWHDHHTIGTCFKKHGYPPHWKRHGNINNIAHDQTSEDGSQSETHEEHLNEQDSSLLAFTPYQYKDLLALLQQ